MKSRKVLISLVLMLALCLMAGIASAAVTTEADLHAAIKNAAANDIIEIQGEITLTSRITSTKNITLKGGTLKTVSGYNDEGYNGIDNHRCVIVPNNSTITLDGTKVIVENMSDDGYTYVMKGRNYHYATKHEPVDFVVLTNGASIEITGTNKKCYVSYVCDVTVDNNSSITLNGTKSIAFQESNLTIADGGSVSIQNVGSHGLSNSKLVVKEGGSIAADNIAYLGLNCYKGSVFEAGSNVSVSNACTTSTSASYKDKDYAISCMNGSLTIENGANVNCDGTVMSYNGKLVIEGGSFKKIEQGTGSVTINGCYAEITDPNGNTRQVIGNSSILDSAVPGSKVTIKSGNLTATLPGNVTVANEGTGVVIINNVAVAKGSSVVTVNPTVDLKGRTPQTGDNSNIALWAILMAISAVSFVALGRKSRFN